MGFNFGAAFSGFADSFVTGFEKGDAASEKRRLRKEKTRGADSDAAARNKLAGEKASGATSGDDLEIPDDTPAPAGQPTVPTAAPAAIKGQYALGGPVAGTTDSVEQSNNEYYTQEAQRTQGDTPSAMPQPAAIDTGEDGGADEGGNPITSTLNWLKNLGRDKSGAIPNATQAQPNPYREVLDPSGKSYPDLTQFIGGVRQVTGAKAGVPLTTADHLRFLQLRTQEFIQRGGSMDEAMKFNAGYLDTARLQSQRTFALASAAWDQGDGKAVQFFVKQGWGLVPDGTTLKTAFKNGKLYTQQFDDKTGKPMGAMETLDKNSFLRRATDITGTTLSFGNHLLDMDEQRKQKYRAARTGSGKAPATTSVSTATGNSLEKLFKADPLLKTIPFAVASATEIMQTMPKNSVTDRTMPGIMGDLLQNKITFVHGETDKRPTGFYRDGKMFKPATEETAVAVQNFYNKVSQGRASTAPAGTAGQPTAPVSAGVPNITKAPGSGTGSGGANAATAASQAPVVSSSAAGDGTASSTLSDVRETLGYYGSQLPEAGRKIGGWLKESLGMNRPDEANPPNQPETQRRPEAIPTNPPPPKKLDSRGREVRSIPDVVSEGAQRLRAYDVKNAEERDRGRALLLADVVRSGKATEAQKQAYQELRAKLGD